MISRPDDLPDDPVLLKQLLLEALARQAKTAEVLQAHEGHIVDLKEQIKLLRDRLFGRKSEQTAEPNTPQLALFNEPESDPMLAVQDAEEEVVAPTARRGKRKPLSADLPRIEVIHELPEHELTCACGCRTPHRSKTTKPYCCGTARQRCHGKPLPRLAVGGVHGSHTCVLPPQLITLRTPSFICFTCISMHCTKEW